MRFSRRRTRAAVANFSETVFALLAAIIQSRSFRDVFGKGNFRSGQIIDDPMGEYAARRVHVFDYQRNTFDASRWLRPCERWRNVAAGAGIFLRLSQPQRVCRVGTLKFQTAVSRGWPEICVIESSFVTAAAVDSRAPIQNLFAPDNNYSFTSFRVKLRLPLCR